MFNKHAKTIYFIRHGSLPDEVKNFILGVCDIPLSDYGFQQAKACGKYLKNIKFDIAYRGNLNRVEQTYQTAQKEMLHLPSPIVDERLNEIDFGDWSFCTLNEIHEKYPNAKEWNMSNMTFQFPNGESIQNFTNRTRGFLSDALKTDHETIAVFSHGGVIMSLLSDIVGLSREHCFSIWLERGCIARVDFDQTGKGKLTHMIEPALFIK